MNMNQNKSEYKSSIEIQAAKLAFIGASITTLGDGITAIAAGITLELLENPTDKRSQNLTNQLETTHKQIDFFINELIQIRKTFR